MRLTELLSPERVWIETSRPNAPALDKPKALKRLAALMAAGTANGESAGVTADEIEAVLAEREALQSTGIGEGVAIPHGALGQLDNQVAALLVVPAGIEFQAIDDHKVNILFAVVGPKRATGEHLKTLARVSRLLRHRAFRDQLIASSDSKAVYDLIASEEPQ